MRRVKLADSLMFLTRGQPIIYYGDEQGFIGVRRRQGRPPGHVRHPDPELRHRAGAGRHRPVPKDRFNTSAPLYQHIKALSALRAANPALADGAQVHRYASSDAGIFAFSRIDKGKRVEYVVALNNATTAKSATFETYGHRRDVRARSTGPAAVRSGKDGRLTVTVPAQSVSVWKATSPMDKPKSRSGGLPHLARRR